MSYRTLRKRYMRMDHGNTVQFKLYDKDHRVMKKATKKATAWVMKQCLWHNWDALHFLATLAKTHNAHE